MLFSRLDDIVGFGEEVDEALKQWRAAIENANNWTVTGDCVFDAGGSSGFSLRILRRQTQTSYPAVCTEEITAAPSADKQGAGKAMLRSQDGEDLDDLYEVDVWSNFTKTVPVGTRLEVAPNGDGSFRLIGADCPLVV